MTESSLFDVFGRTSPRIPPTLNSHTRMMEARLGKQIGSRQWRVVREQGPRKREQRPQTSNCGGSTELNYVVNARVCVASRVGLR